MLTTFTPMLWAFLGFICILFMQRWIHRHLRGVALLMTGNASAALWIYALVLLPGVFLHELSHWVTANLLGVRTGRFSVMPRQQADGSIQLGYVEFYKDRDVGAVKEALIGSAPLVFGIGGILLIGFLVFGVGEITAVVQLGNIDALLLLIRDIFLQPDFWLWLYLIFAISNAMMPSASDRQAWPAFFGIMTLFLFLLSGLFYLFGATGILMATLAGPVATMFSYLALVFSMTIIVNLLFMLIIAVLEYLVGRVRGMHVVYGQAAEKAVDENRSK